MTRRARILKKAALLRSAFPAPSVEVTDFTSLALGCHPKQVKEFTELRKLHGHGGLRYDSEGHCYVTSKRDYVAATRALGGEDMAETTVEPIKP